LRRSRAENGPYEEKEKGVAVLRGGEMNSVVIEDAVASG